MILKRHERRQLSEAEQRFFRVFAVVYVANAIVATLIGFGIGLLIRRYFNL